VPRLVENRAGAPAGRGSKSSDRDQWAVTGRDRSPIPKCRFLVAVPKGTLPTMLHPLYHVHGFPVA